MGNTTSEAYEKAFNADSVSAQVVADTSQWQILTGQPTDDQLSELLFA